MPASPTRFGLTQGVLQGLMWLLGMALGQLSFFGHREVDPAFWASLILGAAGLVFIGWRVDAIRQEHDIDVALIGPPMLQAGILVISALPWLVLAMHSPAWLCVGVVGWPLLALFLDRTAGPWIVGWRALAVLSTRRGWWPVHVDASSTERVSMTDADGVKLDARPPEGVAIELGQARARWTREAATPYRSDQRVRLTRYEPARVTRARRALARAAAWALLSGMLFATAPLSMYVGSALSHPAHPDTYTWD